MSEKKATQADTQRHYRERKAASMEAMRQYSLLTPEERKPYDRVLRQVGDLAERSPWFSLWFDQVWPPLRDEAARKRDEHPAE